MLRNEHTQPLPFDSKRSAGGKLNLDPEELPWRCGGVRISDIARRRLHGVRPGSFARCVRVEQRSPQLRASDVTCFPNTPPAMSTSSTQPLAAGIAHIRDRQTLLQAVRCNAIQWGRCIEIGQVLMRRSTLASPSPFRGIAACRAGPRRWRVEDQHTSSRARPASMIVWSAHDRPGLQRHHPLQFRRLATMTSPEDQRGWHPAWSRCKRQRVAVSLTASYQRIRYGDSERRFLSTAMLLM